MRSTWLNKGLKKSDYCSEYCLLMWQIVTVFVHLFLFCLFPVDSASIVPGLLSIFHEQELVETIHDTNGHGYLATFVGKNGR